MKNIKSFIIYTILFGLYITSTNAQFDINGQLIQRAEYRNGYGKLAADTLDPAAFISQRLRIQTLYKKKNIHFYGSIQDIRTWGNTSQIKLSDGLLSLHEGWAEIFVDTNLSFKIGRQELNYDNARFLGNLDWAMQARAHDFALLKYKYKDHKLHIGGGYNQGGENLTGNTYTVTNQYKTAQMLWYNYKNKKFEISFLFWNNGKQYLKYDSTGKIIITQNMKYTQTIGIPTFKYNASKDNTISGFAYYQMGKDIANKDVKAYDISLQISQMMQIDKKKNTSLKIILGYEMLSGTHSNNTTTTNSSFTPMYGTNHAHNGYMDYFYVSGRYENTTGLNDAFFKIKYDANKKWFVSLDIHNFSSNANIYKASEKLSKGLGNEIDLTAGTILNDDVSLQFGYSQMLAGSTLKYLQGDAISKSENWIYLMLIIRPNQDKKYIGLLN